MKSRTQQRYPLPFRYDSSEYLVSEEAVRAYLVDAINVGGKDKQYMAVALRTAARARARLAAQARESRGY